MTSRLLLVLGAVVVLASGCGAPPCEVSKAFTLSATEARGPLMRPGNNCLRCHAAGGEAANKPFSVGGTVFPTKDAELCGGVEGVTVRVTDSKGKQVTLVSNAAGNFFSAEPLEGELTMEAEKDGKVMKMPGTAPTGGCALCHSWPDPVSAIGHIRAP